MKAIWSIALVTAVLSPALAGAGGLNLSWTDCGSFGAASRTSACANNAEAGTLVCSVVPPADYPNANGQLSVIDLQTDGSTVSPWWQMDTVINTNGCRKGALQASMDFTLQSSCFDPWGGGYSEAVGTNVVSGRAGPNRSRLKCVGSIIGVGPITTQRESYLCKMIIGGQKTVGADACPGCLDGACLVFNDAEIAEAGYVDHHVSNVHVRNHVTWQSGISAPCPGATAVRGTTWGSLKALYR